MLGLGRFVFDVTTELASRGFDDALVGPATVRRVAGTADAWRLVPLPTRAASPADWSRADPVAWLWRPPGSVLGASGADPAYVLGAALHHAIAGAVFPEGAPAREAFARLIRGRAGLPARLGAAVRSALPRSLEPDALALERLILDCLSPSPDAGAALRKFDELAGRLTVDRLIRFWGFENHAATASRLAALAGLPPDPPGAPPAAETYSGPGPAPPPRGSWDDEVPRRLSLGDLHGALDAAWNDIGENGPSRVRFYLAVVQRIAAARPGPLAEVRAAVERLASAHGDRLDESDVLRLAHIGMRYLGEAGHRLGLSNRKFEGRWNEATARLLQARLLLTSGHPVNQVSRLCKEAQAVYESMPEGGGPAGRYARAYLHLLDGIAHLGAAGAYHDGSFYTDAFGAFGRALDLAGKSGAVDLTLATLGWFGRLGRLVKPAPGPPLSLLSVGIDAVLAAHGLTAAALPQGVPEIPWYDEARLFPT